jgi:hypothetical protein
MGRECCQHTSLRSLWTAVFRTRAGALRRVLWSRSRCLPAVPTPVFLIIGLFAPRRLSLPSTSDGSLLHILPRLPIVSQAYDRSAV